MTGLTEVITSCAGELELITVSSFVKLKPSVSQVYLSTSNCIFHSIYKCVSVARQWNTLFFCFFAREFRAHDTVVTSELLSQRQKTNCVNYKKCQLLTWFIARTMIGCLCTVEWRPCKTVSFECKHTLFKIPETKLAIIAL